MNKCTGMNCGATDGVSHSLECHAEHAAAIAGGVFTKSTQPAAPSTNTNGWLEAAVAWEVCASIHLRFAKGKDAFFKTRQGDFVKHAEDARNKATAPAVFSDETLMEAACSQGFQLATQQKLTVTREWCRGFDTAVALLKADVAPSVETCTYKCEAWPECGCAPSVAPTAELWMYDFTDDGKPVKDWTTSSREEAFAPGHFNQRRYVPEQPAVPQDRTRSKDDLWRAHSTGPSPHWNVVLSAAAFHKARAVAGTQSTAEDAALYRGIQAYMHHSMPPDAAPSVAPEPTADVIYQELTDAECDEFRRHYGDFNSMIRLVHNDGHNRHAGRLIQHLGAVFNARFDALAAPPPRAPLTEEIESADNLLRHLGLDPERCRTEGGSLNVSRIKTLLADAAPSVAPEPVAWTLQSELDAAQTTCSAHLWFTNPRNSAWTALFTREQIAAHPPRAPLTDARWCAEWIRNNYQDHMNVASLCDRLIEAAAIGAAK